MGTDWRDNDPLAEPVVEIYQGDRQNYEMPDAPRSNSEKDSIGLWRPKGFVSLALDKGYKLGFEASSDHVSTHMSYCNMLAKGLTAANRCWKAFRSGTCTADGQHPSRRAQRPNLMGDVFSSAETPNLHVKLEGTSKFSKVVVVKDNEYVYSTQPDSEKVEFSWRDNAPAKARPAITMCAGSRTMARSFGPRRCGSLIRGSKRRLVGRPILAAAAF
jgi:hypothetical protein